MCTYYPTVQYTIVPLKLGPGTSTILVSRRSWSRAGAHVSSSSVNPYLGKGLDVVSLHYAIHEHHVLTTARKFRKSRFPNSRLGRCIKQHATLARGLVEASNSSRVGRVGYPRGPESEGLPGTTFFEYLNLPVNAPVGRLGAQGFHIPLLIPTALLFV